MAPAEGHKSIPHLPPGESAAGQPRRTTLRAEKTGSGKEGEEGKLRARGLPHPQPLVGGAVSETGKPAGSGSAGGTGQQRTLGCGHWKVTWAEQPSWGGGQKPDLRMGRGPAAGVSTGSRGRRG